jgi:hypothetical protein
MLKDTAISAVKLKDDTSGCNYQVQLLNTRE